MESDVYGLYTFIFCTMKLLIWVVFYYNVHKDNTTLVVIKSVIMVLCERKQLDVCAHTKLFPRG